MSQPGANILVATKFRFLGDTILAVPALRAVRAARPDARVVLLSGPQARELLAGCPYIDEVIEFDPYDRNRGGREYFRLVRALRRHRFDTALLLNRSLHSAAAAYLAKIPNRVGFISEGRGALLTRSVPFSGESHEIEAYLEVSEAAGFPAGSRDLELWISDEEMLDGRELMDTYGIGREALIIGMQPGANYRKKQWRPSGFARLADYFAERFGARVVLVGGPKERATAEEVVRLASIEPVNLVGKTTLRQAMAVLCHLDLFIGNDTGIMHAAVALGTKTVSIFGFTPASRWGTRSERNRVVSAIDGHIDHVWEEDVLNACRDLLPPAERTRAGFPETWVKAEERPRTGVALFHMNQLGDLLFSLPVMHAIRVQLPSAHLISIVRPEHVELVQSSGLIDEVMVRPYGGWREKWALLRELRRRALSVAVQFSQSYETTFYAYVAGIPRRVGFAGSDFSRLLTDRVSKVGPSSVANNLLLLRTLGLAPLRRDYLGMIRARPHDLEAIDRTLRDHGVADGSPIAVLAPTASRFKREKEWTVEGWRDVAAGLHQMDGVRGVVVGAQGAVPDLGDQVIGLIGRTTVMELVALLQRASVFVGIDSGAMHVAAAAGCPVVALFGPTDPTHTGPMGKRSIIISGEARGMRDILPTDVLAAVQELLSHPVPAEYEAKVPV
jgi:heptosyltransferase-2